MTSVTDSPKELRRKFLSVVFAVTLVLSVAMASTALACVDQFGGSGSFPTPSAPYAPYTAGPVVSVEPYAPYTAGPVVREVKPFAPYTETTTPYAPYTAGPVVREVPFAAYTEKPYAPYTAGPVVHEEPFVNYKLPLK